MGDSCCVTPMHRGRLWSSSGIGDALEEVGAVRSGGFQYIQVMKG